MFVSIFSCLTVPWWRRAFAAPQLFSLSSFNLSLHSFYLSMFLSLSIFPLYLSLEVFSTLFTFHSISDTDSLSVSLSFCLVICQSDTYLKLSIYLCLSNTFPLSFFYSVSSLFLFMLLSRQTSSSNSSLTTKKELPSL